MSKYKVNVGGFVTVFRERDIIVHADNEAEAAKKAELKFSNCSRSVREICVTKEPLTVSKKYLKECETR